MENYSESRIEEIEDRPLSPEELVSLKRHEKEFDAHAAKRWHILKEDVEKDWRTETWHIGEADLDVIGVAHVPETISKHREKIDETVKNSDILITEFAPEAMGLYDSAQAERLKKINSKTAPDLSLEDIRQILIKNENSINLGPFHHEVENTAAKYGKDMVVADMVYSVNLDSFLENSAPIATDILYSKKIDDMALRRLEYLGGAALTSALGAQQIGKDVEKRKISRRSFIGTGLAALAAVAVSKTLIMKVENRRESPSNFYEENIIESARNSYLSLTIRKLIDDGYKKIGIIYGIDHLRGLKNLLELPKEFSENFITENAKILQEYNPDPYKRFHYTDGENFSKKFVPSKHKRWIRTN